MSLLLRLNLAPLKKIFPALVAPFSTSVRQEKRAWTAKLSAEEKKNLRKKEKQAEEAKKLKALATSLPQKGPFTSYMVYTKEQYMPKAHEIGGDIFLVAKALAEEWSSISDSQKQNYRQKALNVRKQYQDNFRNWSNTLSDEERSLLRNKGQKYLSKVQRQALSTGPLTPYQAFTKDSFASVQWENPDNESRKRQFGKHIKEVGHKWNALSESQRQAYKSVQ